MAVWHDSATVSLARLFLYPTIRFLMTLYVLVLPPRYPWTIWCFNLLIVKTYKNIETIFIAENRILIQTDSSNYRSSQFQYVFSYAFRCDCTEKLRGKLDYLRSLLNDTHLFKAVFRYAYDFAVVSVFSSCMVLYVLWAIQSNKWWCKTQVKSNIQSLHQYCSNYGVRSCTEIK